MVFPKKSYWNMILLALSGKMIFLLPENMILPLRRKMKDDLSQKKKKNTWKYDILFKCSQKMVFSKKMHSAMIYLVLIAWQDVFFTWKHDIFSLDEKWNMIFLKKYMEIWYFLYIRVDVTNMILRPSAKRNQGWSSPTKIHLKVTDILYWHSRKSSNNSLYFNGDLYRSFHILLSSEKI